MAIDASAPQIPQPDPVLPVVLLAGGYRRLAAAYAGVFAPGSVREMLDDSYWTLAAAATVRPHLPVLAERFAAERLDALASTTHADVGVPRVLFVCTGNSARSQLAAALLNHHAAGRAVAHSAGLAPDAEIDAAVVASLGEIGIDVADQFPKPLTPELVAAADIVITLGCADVCPLAPGRRYADWPVADPGGGLADTIRGIRDEIDARVTALLAELDTPEHP